MTRPVCCISEKYISALTQNIFKKFCHSFPPKLCVFIPGPCCAFSCQIFYFSPATRWHVSTVSKNDCKGKMARRYFFNLPNRLQMNLLSIISEHKSLQQIQYLVSCHNKLKIHTQWDGKGHHGWCQQRAGRTPWSTGHLQPVCSVRSQNNTTSTTGSLSAMQHVRPITDLLK